MRQIQVADNAGAITRSLVLESGEEQLVVRRAFVTVIAGPDEGLEVALPEGPVLIGRGDAADLQLSDARISRTHVRIYPSRGGWRIADLGSRSGTYVDDLQVDGALLSDDHQLRLGETTLRFHLDEELFVLTPEPAQEIPGLLGESPGMRRLSTLIDKVGPLDLPVLLLGESGTGKELLARAVHDRSQRARAPYVIVDCTQLSNEHLRSELFGHAKGAFTGAVQSRAGAFERADGGTLFLDEVAEIPLDLQPQLLRALEQGQFSRLGGNEVHETRVRVVAATHRDLRAMVDEGAFREDLYYRLAGVELKVPPLRERGADVLRIAESFLPPGKTLAESAEEALRRHPWRGNVRELRNVVRRAGALAEGAAIQVEDLDLDHGGEGEEQGEENLRPSLEDVSEAAVAKRIREALELHDWNQSAAAEALGISRVTLWRKMKRLDIPAKPS